MKILEYNEFDPGKASAQYKKLRKMLEQDDRGRRVAIS